MEIMMVSSVNFIKDAFQSTVEKIYADYSPWSVAEKVTRLAEKGQAQPIETRAYIDLSQFLFRKSMYDYLPGLIGMLSGRRTVHVINDRELILNSLSLGRRSESFEIYPTILESKMDDQNMLL